LIGLGLGIIAGWFRGKKSDKAAVTFSLLFYSMPSFWLGMLAIYLFAIMIPIFPTGGMIDVRLGASADLFTRLADGLRHLILPLLIFSLGFAGQYALIMRNTLTGVLTEDYILTARAKGLSGYQILKNHALKNAALPSITLVAMNIGFVVLGTIAIETVFNWPGVGRLVFESVFFRDFPILQGTFVFFTIFMILANFISDVLYAILDPRVRY
jgi:peptide/nickel transport system permease protein